MPSSWSIKLAGTCRPVSSCPQISPSLRCRQNAPSSIRSKTSGSLCATTGSPTASSNPTTISSTIAATLGTSSSISPGASCPSDCANGRTGSDQRELVLLSESRTDAWASEREHHHEIEDIIITLSSDPRGELHRPWGQGFLRRPKFLIYRPFSGSNDCIH